MRTLPAVVLGAVVGTVAGAGSVYLASGRNGGERATVPTAIPAESTPRTANPAPARGDAVESTADRAALYRLAADADVAEIERYLTQARAEPPSPARDLRLAALLGRYAEIDPARAVALGRELALPATTLAPLYAAWTARAPEPALAALRQIDDPTAAGTIGLAMLPALGGDRAFERIAAALRVRAAPPFGVGAMSLDAGTLALDRLAEGMARQDVRAALALIEEIRGQPGWQVFQAAVLREWGRADPGAALEHIAKLDPAMQQQVLGNSLRELQRLEPTRALEIAARLAEGARRMVQEAAIRQLAETDARAALRYVDFVASGAQQRQALLQTIAGHYGRQDPDAALAWARGLAGERGVLAGVVGGIAANDPGRALELASSLPAAERFQAISSVVMNGARQGGGAAAMADRILELDPQLRTVALQSLFSFWTSGQSEQALEWLVRNGDRVPFDAHRVAAGQIAQLYPATAARYVSRLPAAVRPEWIAAVAAGLAGNDVEAGVTWLDQFRGEAGYAEGVVALARYVGETDPPRAARLLGTVDPATRERSNSMQMVAYQWAQRDPAAAARWLLDLETSPGRAAAMQMVTAAWAIDDLPAARSWALALVAGSERDAALTSVLGVGAVSGAPPDRALAAAFSSGAALEMAVINGAAALAQTDPARARAFVADHLTDRAQRERAEKVIDQRDRFTINDAIVTAQ